MTIEPRTRSGSVRHFRYRGFNLLGKALFSVLMVCCVTNAACPQLSDVRPNYDVNPRRVPLIKPGTVIGKEAPKGWSHLVIKSHPRAAAGDVKQMSDGNLKLCSLLFTGIVANVQAEGSGALKRYRLTGLGVGLGTRIKDQDVIITHDDQQGANLRLLERIVLSKAQEKLQDLTLVARSDTMTIMDAPGVMVRDGKHRPVVLRYAMLVDAKAGGLETLLWLIDRDDKGNYKGVAGDIEWLPPNKMEDCILHVDANEFSLGVPTDNAFAMNRMVQGQKQIAFADDLKAPAGKARLTADLANEMETKLRDALKRAAK